MRGPPGFRTCSVHSPSRPPRFLKIFAPLSADKKNRDPPTVRGSRSGSTSDARLCAASSRRRSALAAHHHLAHRHAAFRRTRVCVHRGLLLSLVLEQKSLSPDTGRGFNLCVRLDHLPGIFPQELAPSRSWRGLPRLRRACPSVALDDSIGIQLVMGIILRSSAFCQEKNRKKF